MMSKLSNSLALFGIVGTATIMIGVSVVNGGNQPCKDTEEMLKMQNEIACLTAKDYALLKENLKADVLDGVIDINRIQILSEVINKEIQKQGAVIVNGATNEKIRSELIKLLD